MKAIIISLSLLISTALYAGTSSVIVLASFKSKESPVSISLPAQYLSAEIRIQSEEDDWSLKLASIDEARRMLIAASEKEGFRVKIDQALVFEPRYSKFSYSSSGGDHDSFSDIMLLAPLDAQSNLIQIVKQFRSVVSGLKPSKKVKVSLGSLFLALEDPEKLREDLLKKIRSHVDSSAKILFNNPDYSISGLDEPLRVRQSGERNVEVYLPFRVVYAEKKNKD